MHHTYQNYTLEVVQRGGGGVLGTQHFNDISKSNGVILALSNIMKVLISLSEEVEVGGLFHNSKKGGPIRVTLEEIGHLQQATPMQTDNSTVEGIANNTIQNKSTKAIDMRLYWLQYQICQGNYNVFWKPGATNFSGYFTEHHQTHHHCCMRPVYLHCQDNSNNASLGVFNSSQKTSLK